MRTLTEAEMKSRSLGGRATAEKRWGGRAERATAPTYTYPSDAEIIRIEAAKRKCPAADVIRYLLIAAKLRV